MHNNLRLYTYNLKIYSYLHLLTRWCEIYTFYFFYVKLKHDIFRVTRKNRKEENLFVSANITV